MLSILHTIPKPLHGQLLYRQEGVTDYFVKASLALGGVRLPLPLP
jgi:hypothetical protein